MDTILRCAIPVVGVLLSASTVCAQGRPPTMEEMHRLHQDPKAYIAMLEDPARDAYQRPHEVLMALGLKEGERVADIGSGTGYFTLRFSAHVGAKGIVYGVDVSPDMIAHLDGRVRAAGLKNVRAILAAPDDPRLPEPVDRVFICDTWHHIPGHPAYLETLKRHLRPGGQVVLVDYQKTPMETGPPMEMRIAREDVVREFEQHGFRLAKEHTFLPLQYFLVFEAAAGKAGR